jgi:CHAD domain-containing protein
MAATLTPRTRSAEHELTFALDSGFSLPRWRGSRILPRVFSSTYYDTDDYRLALLGVTLCDVTSDRSGWWELTVPQRAGRLEVKFRRDNDVPPAAARESMAALLRGGALRPIAQLRTRRQGVRVRAERGARVDVTVDGVDLVSGGKVIGHFEEAQAELISGDKAALCSIRKSLKKAGARTVDQRPALFRALGLGAAPEPKPGSPIARLREQLRRHEQHMLVHDIGSRLRTDPEDVHQMRVAIRGIRALLRAARPLLVAEWAAHLREELAWISDVLGAARDLDVLVARIRDDGRSLSPLERRGLARLMDELELERGSRVSALHEALQSQRYLALLEHIAAAANAPVVTDARCSLEEIAGTEFRKLQRAVRKAGDNPTDAVLHRIRIKTKRARHAAELAASEGGRSARRFIRRAKDLADILGAHHDAIVATQRLRKLLAAGAGHSETRRVLHRLIERQAKRRLDVRRVWRQGWRKVKKAGKAAWS